MRINNMRQSIGGTDRQTDRQKMSHINQARKRRFCW